MMEQIQSRVNEIADLFLSILPIFTCGAGKMEDGKIVLKARERKTSGERNCLTITMEDVPENKVPLKMKENIGLLELYYAELKKLDLINGSLDQIVLLMFEYFKAGILFLHEFSKSGFGLFLLNERPISFQYRPPNLELQVDNGRPEVDPGQSLF